MLQHNVPKRFETFQGEGSTPVNDSTYMGIPFIYGYPNSYLNQDIH